LSFWADGEPAESVVHCVVGADGESELVDIKVKGNIQIEHPDCGVRKFCNHGQIQDCQMWRRRYLFWFVIFEIV
jgi:hypothetical protein